jgi:hypothetical protein
MELETSASQQAAELEPFDVAIAELERVAGDFLTGPGRMRCMQAFDSDPAAFAFLVRKTMTKTGTRSLLGLFVRIVNDEHAQVSARLARTRAAAADGSSTSPAVDGSGPCFICEQPATTRLKGQFWCKLHLEEGLEA